MTIYIFAAQEQKGLGTIGVRHVGYHLAYKVLVCHVVGHSRPASVALTLRFLYASLLFCKRKSL